MERSPEPRLTRQVGIRLEPADYAEVEKLARLEKRSPSEWMRLKILKAIGRD